MYNNGVPSLLPLPILYPKFLHENVKIIQLFDIASWPQKVLAPLLGPKTPLGTSASEPLVRPFFENSWIRPRGDWKCDTWATKHQLGLRKKIFIRSTALYVFHTAEPFKTIKTKCLLYYSHVRWMSKQLSVGGRFYITVQTVQQFSHFSTSSTRKWCLFGRQDNRKQNLLRIFMSRIFSVLSVTWKLEHPPYCLRISQNCKVSVNRCNTGLQCSDRHNFLVDAILLGVCCTFLVPVCLSYRVY